MIGHDYPGMNHESFILDAIFKAVEHNMAVLISGKNINPAYDGEGNKDRCLRGCEICTYCS
jgi:hypothetical protein